MLRSWSAAGLPPWRLFALVLGPALGLGAALSPAQWGLPEPAWRLAGLTAWMVVWWLSEAVPIAATALLPIGAAPLLGVAPEREIAAAYAHPLVFLFLGGFILAAALGQSGLHRRVALGVLRFTGAGAAGIVGGFMAATARSGSPAQTRFRGKRQSVKLGFTARALSNAAIAASCSPLRPRTCPSMACASGRLGSSCTARVKCGMAS